MQHTIPVEGGVIGSAFLPSKGGKGITLIYVNGGPGGTYLDENHSIGALASDRDVILYDQLGSYHSPAAFDETHTRMERFVEELDSILNYYDIEQGIILGHSFGGTIAADYALAYPDKVAGLILSSALLSTPRWIDDANTLLDEMPDAERQVIRDALAGKPVQQDAYDHAEKLFYSRHLCRLDPWPPRMLEGFSKGNKEIYNAMWGRSEFTCTGTLKDYDRFPDLHKLRMPVLLTCGRYDEARPETIKAAANEIPGSEFIVFEHSAHAPLYEQRDEYLAVMEKFCQRVDVGKR